MARGKRDFIENNNTPSGLTMGSPTTINCPQNVGIVHEHEYELFVDPGGGADPAHATRAQIEAACSKLELLLNSGTHSEYHVTDILKMNDFYGHTFVDGFFTQFFTQDWRENSFDAERNAFVPGAVRAPKFRLHTKPGGALIDLKHRLVTEGIGQQGRAVVATNPSAAVRPLIRHEVETITLTDTGDVATRYNYDAATQFIRSLNFEGDNITGIVIKINGVEEFNFRSLTRLNERLKQSRAVAVPQANTWHINFELLAGSMNGIYQPEFPIIDAGGKVIGTHARDEIEVRIFASNTNNVRLLAELYDTPDARS